MRYFLDLGDGQPPIECASEARALFLSRCWVTIRDSNIIDQKSALRELREAIVETTIREPAESSPPNKATLRR